MQDCNPYAWCLGGALALGGLASVATDTPSSRDLATGAGCLVAALAAFGIGHAMAPKPRTREAPQRSQLAPAQPLPVVARQQERQPPPSVALRGRGGPAQESERPVLRPHAAVMSAVRVRRDQREA